MPILSTHASQFALAQIVCHRDDRSRGECRRSVCALHEILKVAQNRIPFEENKHARGQHYYILSTKNAGLMNIRARFFARMHW